MAKINITIQATLTKLNTYALEQGYLEQVAVGQEVDGTTIMGPNPQTKHEFLSERLKNKIVKDLASAQIDAIDREIRDKRIADKEAVIATINSNVTVSIA
jgi:hypothetical protein